ncbi:unnamed protein product [Echinostoma caproni]|uniref:Protein kinase domain-containing protein n=1 Tax=Echinostoma caproni TaxID=27848 RepID=A0A183A6I8_9TREM|nr:unnamed protein product [Echinostoma caproni]
MTEPSRSNTEDSKRSNPVQNHWFDASLIPSSRTMGMEVKEHTGSASGDDETYNLGRQFSKIAVDAFREGHGKVDSDRTSERCSSVSRITFPSRSSRSEDVQQSTTRRSQHHHQHQHHHRHQQYTTPITQTVPSHSYTQAARSLPKSNSPSSSPTNPVSRQQPPTPSRTGPSVNSVNVVNMHKKKPLISNLPKLHTAPSQPVLLHTSSCGSDECSDAQLPPFQTQQVRPFSIHIASKLDQHNSCSPESSNSEQMEQSVRSTCKMRSAPSCPSHLGPLLIGTTDLDSQDQKVRDVTAPCRIANNNPPSNSSSNCPKPTPKPDLRDRVCPGQHTAGTFGLYNIQETIGAGNFSQVKLATHVLTKGK